MEHAEHEPADESYQFVSEEAVIDALEHGPPPFPVTLAPGTAAIAAAGRWGRYGSVIVLFRDHEDGELYDDTYLVVRSPDGQWQYPPPTSGGGSMPEWVLRRPDEPLPGWRGNHLRNLSARLDKPGTEWVTDLTVMATRRVATVQVRYAGEVIDVPVPPGGLVTVPHAIRHVDDSAEFRGFDASGGLIAVTRYRPLTDADRKSKWPDPSLWTD